MRESVRFGKMERLHEVARYYLGIEEDREANGRSRRRRIVLRAYNWKNLVEDIAGPLDTWKSLKPGIDRSHYLSSPSS